jgi:DNA (cytosine-5)-methyltransferase 1
VSPAPHRATLTIGLNRGKPRLWLQAGYMVRYGFDRGASYTVTLAPGRVTLALDPAGKRKVAGKAGKPIIDVNTKALAKAFEAGAKVTVLLTEGHIQITLDESSRAHRPVETRAS